MKTSKWRSRHSEGQAARIEAYNAAHPDAPVVCGCLPCAAERAEHLAMKKSAGLAVFQGAPAKQPSASELNALVFGR